MLYVLPKMSFYLLCSRKYENNEDIRVSLLALIVFLFSQNLVILKNWPRGRFKVQRTIENVLETRGTANIGFNSCESWKFWKV